MSHVSYRKIEIDRIISSAKIHEKNDAGYVSSLKLDCVNFKTIRITGFF